MTLEFEGTDRYRVIRLIGEGGMGVVYEVEDREREQRVALKTLKRRDVDTVYRLKKEFRSLADLGHPNLIGLYDLVVEGDDCFYTMELVGGTDIVGYCRGVDPGRAATARPSQQSIEETAPYLEGHQIVRSDGRVVMCDERRLRGVLPQLVRGLMALHQAGMVHRDIKPSNVLITPDERLVLLDFGLVADLGPSARDSFRGRIVGTVEYMAPEQAAGEGLTPAADWYSVGVLIYEAMTGRVPFHGSIMEILLHKQKYPAPPPRAALPGVPEDLDALCVELLAREPGRRPRAREVLERLGAEPDAHAARESMSAVTELIHFTGRTNELAQLEHGFAGVERGRAAAVVVRGPSGIGKSALVGHYINQLYSADPELVVLEGRCYARENVPYKAMDAVVDELASLWAGLPDIEAAQLLPLRPALLRRLFPVLARVPVIADAPEQEEIRDPQLLRTRAYAALRETLARLASRRSVVLALDDLQWVDRDSVDLLTDLMRPPDPPALRLILSSRDESSELSSISMTEMFRYRGDLDADSQTGLERLLDQLDVPTEVIDLGPLSDEDSFALASAVLSGAPPELAARVANESDGIPLFIAELGFFLQDADHDRVGQVSLNDVIRARVKQLSDIPRALVELISVAGEPISQRVAATAIGCESETLAREVRYLRTSHLVQAPTFQAENRLEPYHDRMRESVRASLGRKRLQELHHQLALALQKHREGTPERLARHWHGAGHKDRAAELARTAAELAVRKVDFDKAAKLYRMALDLGAHDVEEARALCRALGEALLAAGRPSAAARRFSEAAEGADPATRLELHHRSASALLLGGYVEEGFKSMRAVLAEIGMQLAPTPRRALMSLLMRRAWRRVRGYGWKERQESDIPQSALTRVDILGSVAVALGVVDNIRGAEYQARHLAMALSLGEPARVARALGVEACFLASQGSRRALVLAERAASIRETQTRAQIPFDLWARGAVAFFIDNRWRVALDWFSKTQDELRRRVETSGWAMDSAQLYHCFCQVFLGEVGDLTRSVPALVREALRRGDLYAAVNLRTRLNFLWLVRDDVAGARRDLEAAVSVWAPSSDGFQIPHYWEMYGQVELSMYAGDIEGASEALRVGERPLIRSLMMRAPMVRIEYAGLIGRVAIRHGERAAAKGQDVRPFVATVRRAAKKLARESQPTAEHFRLLLLAAADHLSGDEASALRGLREAVQALGDQETQLYANAARRRLGEIIGGSEGAALIERVDTWMRKQTVRSPERLSEMLVPGFQSRG